MTLFPDPNHHSQTIVDNHDTAHRLHYWIFVKCNSLLNDSVSTGTRSVGQIPSRGQTIAGQASSTLMEEESRLREIDNDVIR